MVGPSLHRDQIMAMNRVQFQAGLSLPAFFKRYGNAQQCEQALEISRWPQGFVCPRCAATAHSRFQRHGTTYWQCTACYRQTSLRSGTVMDNSKLPLRHLAAWHVSAGPEQDEPVGAGVDATPGSELPDSVANEAQADAGHDPTRGEPQVGRDRATGRCLPGRRTQRWQGRARLGEQAPFRDRRGDH
ncbi:transposase [Xanthomonas oryzae pv. oryzae KACC 10331]|uniref:Transposase n=1 Tax=Xanthomonas oryzae pv. oryzae (strain KACC10331 / KXO85) TaxID=291331 RepID=Q05I47_XANOR|nr:transposase [Xanthomonas oryzae pv. oryzae KACC 10331]